MTYQRIIELTIEIFIGAILTSMLGVVGYFIATAYESLATAIKDLTSVLSGISDQQARTETRVDEHERRLNEHAVEINHINERCYDMHTTPTTPEETA